MIVSLVKFINLRFLSTHSTHFSLSYLQTTFIHPSLSVSLWDCDLHINGSFIHFILFYFNLFCLFLFLFFPHIFASYFILLLTTNLLFPFSFLDFSFLQYIYSCLCQREVVRMVDKGWMAGCSLYIRTGLCITHYPTHVAGAARKYINNSISPWEVNLLMFFSISIL